MIRPATDSGLPEVLLITRNLPPLRGGMERLCLHIAQSFSNSDFELSVIGPEGCAEHLPEKARVNEVPHRSLMRFLLATALAARKATRRSYRIVIAGSGLAAPIAWWAARRAHAPWVVYLHGLDIIAPSVIYQRCWLPFIRRADMVLVNSCNTRRLAVEHGVPSGTIEILHPGTELPAPDAQSGLAFREAHGLGDRAVMLAVGRLTHRKGLAEFVREILPRIVAASPDVLLLIVGADADDAVRPAAVSEHARIVRSAEDAGVSGAMRILPPCDDAMLSAAYRAADVHVFPVLDLPHDVEGFGMVAIEAAAHGLPTVAFDVGGVSDAVMDGVSGSLVQAGDHALFAALVLGWLERRGDPRVRDQCSEAASDFSWERFSGNLQIALRDRLWGDA